MAKKKPKTSRKKGFSFRNLLSIILGIIAIELLFYPIVVNYLAGQQNIKSVQKYDENLSNIGSCLLYTSLKVALAMHFLGKVIRNAFLLKKTAVHFCRVFILRESRQKSYGQNVRLKAIPYLLNLGLTVIH